MLFFALPTHRQQLFLPALALLALLLGHRTMAQVMPAITTPTLTLFGKVDGKTITITRASLSPPYDKPTQLPSTAAITTALPKFFTDHAKDGKVSLHLPKSADLTKILLQVQDQAVASIEVASLQDQLLAVPFKKDNLDSTAYNLVLGDLATYVGDNSKTKATELQFLLKPVDTAWKIEGADFYRLGKLDAPDKMKNRSATSNPDLNAIATEAEVLAFLKDNAAYPSFHDHQVYRQGNVVYLFMTRDLKMAPGTAWPSCNEKGFSYQAVVIDRPAAGFTDYQLQAEADVVRDLEINIDGAGASFAQAAGSTTPVPVEQLAVNSLSAREGTLLITVTLTAQVTKEGGAKPSTEHNQRVFRLADCDAHFHVGIMLGINASFLSNPTNIALTPIPSNSSLNTLSADDPTTHQALTVMALFYPTPRRYGYEYKELSFFQKFNVSVGSQVGPALLSDVLLGLNYEVSRGLNFGAGGHYGRHRVITGYPNFEFGKDVYSGATFVEAINTRLQWDLAWYVGLGIDLRVVGVLSGRDKEVRDLRAVSSTPTTP